MEEIHNWKSWIGTDEAGKGDYFGPLVVAGVYVDGEICNQLLAQGITDGKKVSKQRIRKLANWMWNHHEQHIVVIEKMPHEYNSHYSTLQENGDNLNTMLVNLHAEVIQKLVDITDAKYGLVDQFAKNGLIEKQLMNTYHSEKSQSNSKIKIREIPKAERDIAVAAASIIARDAFLRGIEALSQQYKIKLPRGSYKVIDTGKEFVKLHGTDALRNVAKLHFRLTKVVLEQ